MLTPIIETYNVEEEPLYDDTYKFIKGFCTGRKLNNSLKALPLARKIHNGQYRKGTVMFYNERRRLPYVLHVLKVCSTLISLELPISDKELDILCSAALLHDSLEDNKEYFMYGENELVDVYHFPEEVLEIVKLVSKRSGASEEEISEYFNKIKKNRFALLVKLSDRSHNVEDLYNMKTEKLHSYVRETREYIYPLAEYAKANYPEISNGVVILKSKIRSLTEATEAITEMFEETLAKKDQQIADLEKKIAELKASAQ